MSDDIKRGCKVPTDYMNCVNTTVIPTVARYYNDSSGAVTIEERKRIYRSITYHEAFDATLEVAYRDIPRRICDQMYIVKQSADGTCLFHALGFIVGISGKNMRNKICDWYDSHSVERLLISKEINDEYVRTMRHPSGSGENDNGWGGEYEALVFMKLYNGLYVHIYEIGGNMSRYIDAPNEIKRTINNTVILCSSGKHFDVLIPKSLKCLTDFLNETDVNIVGVKMETDLKLRMKLQQEHMEQKKQNMDQAIRQSIQEQAQKERAQKERAQKERELKELERIQQEQQTQQTRQTNDQELTYVQQQKQQNKPNTHPWLSLQTRKQLAQQEQQELELELQTRKQLEQIRRERQAQLAQLAQQDLKREQDALDYEKKRREQLTQLAQKEQAQKEQAQKEQAQKEQAQQKRQKIEQSIYNRAKLKEFEENEDTELLKMENEYFRLTTNLSQEEKEKNKANISRYNELLQEYNQCKIKNKQQFIRYASIQDKINETHRSNLLRERDVDEKQNKKQLDDILISVWQAVKSAVDNYKERKHTINQKYDNVLTSIYFKYNPMGGGKMILDKHLHALKNKHNYYMNKIQR